MVIFDRNRVEDKQQGSNSTNTVTEARLLSMLKDLGIPFGNPRNTRRDKMEGGKGEWGGFEDFVEYPKVKIKFLKLAKTCLHVQLYRYSCFTL